MEKEDIILAKLDRIESKQDKMADRLEEVALTIASHQTSIGFLKAAVGGIFTTLFICIGYLFTTK